METERNTLQQQLFRTEAEHIALLEKLDRRELLSKAMEDETQKLSDQLNKIEQKSQTAENDRRNLEDKLAQIDASKLEIEFQALNEKGYFNRKRTERW